MDRVLLFLLFIIDFKVDSCTFYKIWNSFRNQNQNQDTKRKIFLWTMESSQRQSIHSLLLVSLMCKRIAVLVLVTGIVWKNDKSKGRVAAMGFKQRRHHDHRQQHSSSSILPWGDVNVVVVTDVHSWVGGHGYHEPLLDANYGDVLSFYQHLQHHAAEHDQDLFFVMNGDFVDGTGLSTVPPEYLTPILQHMPWDAVNIGNHELYHNGRFLNRQTLACFKPNLR